MFHLFVKTALVKAVLHYQSGRTALYLNKRLNQLLRLSLQEVFCEPQELQGE